MEKLPQSVLKRLQGTPSEGKSHPDSDLLTAFAEHSLASPERGAIVDHLAQCGECRDILAIAMDAKPEAQIESQSSDRSIVRRWLGWPALRWTALAAGLLIVASVGVFQYSHRQQTVQVASNSPSPQKTLSPLPSLASNLDRKAVSTSAPDSMNAPAIAKKATRTDLRREPGLGPQPEIRRDSGAAADADVAKSTMQLAQNQPVPAFSGQNLNQDVVKAKDPVPAQSSAAKAASTVPQNPATLSAASIRWAIKDGVLLRSGDEGRNWQNVYPGADSSTEFLAIAVNDLEVWAGGTAGSLYYSRDGGLQWARVTPSADGTSVSGNIIGIQFADANHGKIATSTSEMWTTSDSGQTWQKQK